MSFLEFVQREIINIVVDVTSTDFLVGSAVNVGVDINFVVFGDLLLELDKFRDITTSVDG